MSDKAQSRGATATREANARVPEEDIFRSPDPSQLPVPITIERASAVKTPEEVLADIETSIERRAGLLKRIHELIHKQIDPRKDIRQIGGMYRRTINFARKVYRIVGGSFEYYRDARGYPMVHKIDYEDTVGRYYVYRAYGCYLLPWGERVEGIGFFSSRDPFFGREGDAFKPTEDVCEGDIHAAAMTECFKQCVFVALGFSKDMALHELAACGIDAEKVEGHEFQKGVKSAKAADDDASAEMRAEIERICRALFSSGWCKSGHAQPRTAEDVLRMATARKYTQDGEEKMFEGWKSFASITPKSLPITLRELREISKRREAEDNSINGVM